MKNLRGKMRLLQINFFIGMATAIALQVVPWKVKCPQQCVCQIRPWYTPKSAYREAPTVDCNDLLAIKVPVNLPSETQTLLLQSNNIAKINQADVDYLKNLLELDLSQNSFSSIHDFGIRNMPQLLSLHLEENQLKELSENCFSGLPQLQELYLNHNQLKAISPRAFTGLGNLLRLHLNSNLLWVIDSRWFEELQSLEILMIGENPVFSILDMNFRPLTNLRSLVLAGMNLKEISDYALYGLMNLESLSFYDNKLVKVPKEALQKVPGLKFLDLNKNPIQRIQQNDFANMLHLKELGINNMDELVSIDQYALSNLPELTKLEVTNNPKLSFIHPNAFHMLPQMETLMLNNNALSALHKQTVESLPNLQEISIHSNPIQCDCILRWVNTTENHIRFMEPQSTLCADPPDLKHRHVREVPFREMTDRCLPLISVNSFPPHLDAEMGETLSFHCRALAEPEPQIYWVTPSGYKILPFSYYGKYKVHPEGTLEIRNITIREGGVYTCVAHNLIGADTKSVAVKVNGKLPTGEDSIRFYTEEVQAYHALVSWKLNLNTVSTNLTWWGLTDSTTYDSTNMARVPTGTSMYNITRLQPSTDYVACLHVAYINLQMKVSCVSIRTVEVTFQHSIKEAGKSVIIVGAFCISLLAVTIVFLCSFGFLRTQYCLYKQLQQQSKEPMQDSLTCSVQDIYPSFVKPSMTGMNISQGIGIEVKTTTLDS